MVWLNKAKVKRGSEGVSSSELREVITVSWGPLT